MHTYIKRGRFGEFVYRVIDRENQRRKVEAEKEEDNRLWIAYVHSMAEKSFPDWQNGLRKEPQQMQSKNQPFSLSMTDKQVEEAKQRARGILKRFSPN